MKLPKLNKKKWIKRLRDPVWQFVGVVVAIMLAVVSTLVAYDILYRSQAGPELTVRVSRKVEIVARHPDYESELEVLYRGEKVEDVSAFYLLLQNTGTSAIRPGDYIYPIRLSVEPPAEIASIEIFDQKPSGLDLSFTQTLTNAIELSQSLLNAGDAVEFRVIVINDSSPGLMPSLLSAGRIVGVNEITISPEQWVWAPFTSGIIGFGVPEAAAVGTMASLLFFAVLLTLRRRGGSFWSRPFLEARIVILAAVTLCVVSWGNLLVGSLFSEHKPSYWEFWSLPIAVGAVVTIIYVLYIFVQLWKGRSDLDDTERDAI